MQVLADSISFARNRRFVELRACRPAPGRFASWLLLMLLASGIGRPAILGAMEPPTGAEAPVEWVRLVIDYGDGVQKHFHRLPCARE